MPFRFWYNSAISTQRSPVFMLCRSIRLIVQLVYIPHQIPHLTSILAILPFPSISNASYFSRQPHCTALRHVVFSTPLYTVPQHVDTMRVLIADAAVDLVKTQAVLESAILHEAAVRDVGVVGYHAVGETEVEFRFWIEVGGAEEDDVSEAFGRAVHTGYGVRVGVDAGDREVSFHCF